VEICCNVIVTRITNTRRTRSVRFVMKRRGCCCNLSASVLLNVRFATSGMCAKNSPHIFELLHTQKPARNQGGENLGISPQKIFKTLHCNFDICRNFHKIKMKFCILVLYKKPSLNFSLYYWLISAYKIHFETGHLIENFVND